MLRRRWESRSAYRPGADHEKTETDPGADQWRQRARCRRDTSRQRSRQGIDDTAEQHRLDELRRGQRDIGKRQRDGQPRVGPQQSEDAKVDADKGHDAVLAANGKRTTSANSWHALRPY
jgi:hypothetical protein